MSHLLRPAELARELSAVVVIDARWSLTGPPGRGDYERGHIPGAFFVDLETELAGPPGPGGRHPLPDPAVVEATLRRCGVGPGTRVVTYDGADSFAAARAWWVFRWVGLPDVRVLDGGYAAWLRDGLPVTTVEPEPATGSFTARPGQLAVLDADSAARVAREGLLVDARAPERYAGEVEPIDPVAGHIPGAVNVPTLGWAGRDGTFRTDLAERWARVSAGRGGGAVAAYCGSGVSAAHTVLALAEIGVDAALYAGSWSEWVADPSRPVATGMEPAARN